MTEIREGEISTWLSPDGVVCRVRIVSLEDGENGTKVFEGYRVDEKNDPLKSKTGAVYPLFSGTVDSLGG